MSGNMDNGHQLSARSVIGKIAVGLGLIGSVLSVIVAGVLLWYGVQINAKLRGTQSNFNMRSTSVQDKLVAFDSKISSADDVTQIQDATKGLSSALQSASDVAEGISTNPLYQNLPVETDVIDALLERVQRTAVKLDTISEVAPSFAVNRLKTQLLEASGEAQDSLEQLTNRVDTTLGKLRVWMGITIFGGILLAFWSLWSQYALFRLGLFTPKGPKARSHEEVKP